MSRQGLLSGSAVYLFSNVLAAATPFVLLPILTRHLTPSEYGQVAIYQTMLAALGAFVGFSAQGAASIKYYDDDLSKTEFKFFLGNCLLVLASSAAMVLFITLFFWKSLSNWLVIDASWIFLSIFVSSSSFIVAMRMTQWQIKKQAKSYGVFQVSQSLFSMFFSLLLVVYLLQGAAGRMWALSVIPFVYAVFALFLLYKDDLLGFAWRPTHFREILAFGVPLIPHSVGAFLISSVDRFIINDQLGLAKVGIYMVAVQLTATMGLVFDAINNAYVPWLFERLKRNQSGEKKQLVRWTYIYCIALLGIATLAFIIGPSLLVLIAGDKYSEAADIVGWLALGQVFHGMYFMVTNYIFYSKRTALLSLSTITSGLINVGLLMFLISLMGLKGAAIAFAISMVIKFLLTWRVAQMSHPMPWFSL